MKQVLTHESLILSTLFSVNLKYKEVYVSEMNNEGLSL